MVSPLITTTATMHPSFFDDRDHLFTAIAPTSDVNHLASTSLQNRVTETPFSVPYTPFTRHSDPPPMLSSTLRPIVTTAPTTEIKMTGNSSRPATSLTTGTSGSDGMAITTTAPTYRSFGDNLGLLRKYNEQVRPQTTNIGYQPPLDAAAQIAAALDRLAVSNEAALLPKSELITFDSNAKNYQRFITSFNMIIDARNISASTKLIYLIQYCEGKAKKLIEDCVMMAQPDGYNKARQILKSEFGKRHEIARSHIDSLTTGKQLAANDYDGLMSLSPPKCRNV